MMQIDAQRRYVPPTARIRYWATVTLCLLLSGSELAAQQPADACDTSTLTSLARIPNCIRLIPTRHDADAGGVVVMSFAPSPFTVAVTADGRAIYDLEVRTTGLEPRPGVTYVAWATTPDLSERLRLGALGADSAVTGRVAWNKFLVLVTAESSDEGETWTGPVLLTGVSPSGRLQTMAGEEIFGNNESPVGSRYCLVNKC